jgi:hypothetical protein
MAQTLKARRAPANTEVTYHDVAGKAHHIKADAKGLIKPRSAEEDLVLARFGYGHAAAQRPARSRSRSKTTRAAKAPATTSDAADKGSDSGSE